MLGKMHTYAVHALLLLDNSFVWTGSLHACIKYSLTVLLNVMKTLLSMETYLRVNRGQHSSMSNGLGPFFFCLKGDFYCFSWH